MKKQINKRQNEVEKWKKGDRVILSMKDLVFKKRPAKKLTERYIRPYVVKEVVLRNMVKLKLLVLELRTVDSFLFCFSSLI